MFNKKTVYISAALILAGFIGVSAASAQSPTPCLYTIASLHGNYSTVTNYGANVARSFGTRYLDGSGNLTGTFLLNAPTAGSTTGERTITTGTQTGTYTVNCNGTGTFIRVIKSNGVTANTVDDFIITAATRSLGGYGNQMIATTIADAQETPSALIPGGLFVTRVHTLLPELSF
jgi:hypothetical protein